MALRRGHMAMLVAAGFLDNLCLEAEGRRILVKGRTSKEMVMVEDSPEKEVPPGKLKTTWSPWTCAAARSPTSQHRRLTHRAAPRGPVIPPPEPAGPRFVWTQRNTPIKKERKHDADDHDPRRLRRCGQPIAPGEPAMQTASVDIIDGQAVSTPVKSYT